MSKKVLGEKIKEFIHDLVNDGDSEFEIHDIQEELDQLIEDKKHLEWLKETTTVKSINHMIVKNKKLTTRVDELEEELEADHAASEEIIDDLTIDYNQMCEENEQLKQDALLGKAVMYAIRKFHTISIYGSGRLCVLLLGDKYDHADLIYWYEGEMLEKQQLEKEGK